MKKSKWNKAVIEKYSQLIICATCNLSRNRFAKGTYICITCADKLSNRARKAK